MRRSSRERKSVDHFSPAKFEFETQPSESDSGSDSGSENETKMRKVAPTKKKTAAAPNSKQASTTGQNSLFGCTTHPKNINNSIDKFLANYSKNRIGAMAELLNFIILSAGSQKSYIKPSVDIDGLNAEELDELLSDATSAMSKKKSAVYPLTTNVNKIASIRANYVKVWETLASKIMNHSDRARLLSTIAELLISLSSMSTASIRHAVTEGALCLGRVLLKNAVDLSKKLSDMERQSKASSSGGGNKHRAVLTMQKDTKKLHKALEEHISTLFNSIFIHRYKDSSEVVRSRCCWHLSEWILCDPEKYFDDDYLKYVGWMSSDRSELVRREAIAAVNRLLVKKQYLSRLLNFTERFMDRFIEMAVGDTDEQVSLETVIMMRTMQTFGLMDSLEQEKLDQIDSTVFDVSASPQVRTEVLGFVMDHTEGFDDDQEEEGDSRMLEETAEAGGRKGANKGKKRKNNGKGDDSELLALSRKKKVVAQIETFLEFAELHLMHNHDTSGGGDDRLELVLLLADACLAIESKCGIVKDWSVMISLLMRDGGNLFDIEPLADEHVAILLRLFVCSATRVKQWHVRQTLDGDECERRTGKNTSSQGDMHITMSDYEDLQTNLISEIPTLLKRFKGDDSSTELLVDLVACCEVPVGSGSGESRALQGLVKVCLDIFESVQSEKSLSKLSAVMRGWMTANSTKKQKAHVKNVVRDLMAALYDKMKRAIADVIDEVEREMAGGIGGKHKRSSSKGAGQLKDVMFTASSATKKYCALWTNIDCREVVDEATAVICEELSPLLSSLCSLLETSHRLSEQDAVSMTGIMHNAGRAMWHMLLWSTREVYIRAREKKDDAEEGSENGDIEDDELANELLNTREVFLDTLSRWMDCGMDGNLKSEYVTAVSQLQCEAFRLIGDVRMAFPMKEAEYDVVKQLAWSPPMEMLQKMERVFSAEDIRIKSTLAGLGESERDVIESEKLSRQLVENLLCPLSGSMYDIDNLNRRQAAALMSYIVDPSSDVQKVVRSWIKTLKDKNIGKYLEAILVALKKSYEEKVRPLIAQHRAAVEQFGVDDEDDEDYPAALQEEGEALVHFAQKLAQSLGVGKAKGATKEFLVMFFKVGIAYALQEVDNGGFLDLLDPFLRLLGESECSQVQACFDDACESSSTSTKKGLRMMTAGEDDDRDDDDNDDVVNAFCATAFSEFTSHLRNVSGKVGYQRSSAYTTNSTLKKHPSPMPSKQSTNKRLKVTHDIVNEEEDEAEGEAPISVSTSMKSRQSKEPGARRSSGRAKSSRGSYAEQSGYEEEEEEDGRNAIKPTRSQSQSQSSRGGGRYSSQSTISDITMDDINEDVDDDIFSSRAHSRGPASRVGKVTSTLVNARMPLMGTTSSGVGKTYGSQKSSGGKFLSKNRDVVMGLHIEDDFEEDGPSFRRSLSSASGNRKRRISDGAALSPIATDKNSKQYQDDDDFFDGFELLPTHRRR